MARDSIRKRGWPPKFGREAHLISITLPRDVINWLGTIDDDLGWAIVKLHERSTKSRSKDASVAQLELRALLKQWRQEGLRFESRSIIVAHGTGTGKGES